MTVPEKNNAESAAKNLAQLKDPAVRSMGAIVFEQFLQHKAAVAGAVVILLLASTALLAPLISYWTGLDPEAQNALNRYAPPLTKLSVSLDTKEYTIEKFWENYPEGAKMLSQRLKDGGIVNSDELEDVLRDLVAKDTSEVVSILTQSDLVEARLLLPEVKNFDSYHILGTDELGRDVFIRLIYGSRVSMGVGILVAITAALIGLLIGAYAGYYGGIWDAILMRVTDSMLSLPILPILIVVAAVDLNKLPGLKEFLRPEMESIFKMIVILNLFSWMTVARLVRSSVLSLREREFILAAKALGASDIFVIAKHILPNVLAPLMVSVTLGVGQTILFEAALSYLGLGIQQPTPSWGNMLTNAQELLNEAPLLAIIPGILIFLTTISINYIGDGLQEAIDPKAVRR